MFTHLRGLVASALVLTLALPGVAAAAEDEPTVTSDTPERPPATLHEHRYAFIAGGVLLLGGAGLGYLAQGDLARARTSTSARDATAALGRAQASAATANVLYGLAGATLIYGLVLEFLPEPVAEKASLTFHF
jgi:hypothetical protein